MDLGQTAGQDRSTGEWTSTRTRPQLGRLTEPQGTSVRTQGPFLTHGADTRGSDRLDPWAEAWTVFCGVGRVGGGYLNDPRFRTLINETHLFC